MEGASSRRSLQTRSAALGDSPRSEATARCGCSGGRAEGGGTWVGTGNRARILLLGLRNRVHRSDWSMHLRATYSHFLLIRLGLRFFLSRTWRGSQICGDVPEARTSLATVLPFVPQFFGLPARQAPTAIRSLPQVQPPLVEFQPHEQFGLSLVFALLNFRF